MIHWKQIKQNNNYNKSKHQWQWSSRSPIVIQIVVTHQAEKKFGCTTAQGATFNMRGQLYRGHANATALSSCQTTWVLVLARARRCALETFEKKKMLAPLLGLGKSIYYFFM